MVRAAHQKNNGGNGVLLEKWRLYFFSLVFRQKSRKPASSTLYSPNQYFIDLETSPFSVEKKQNEQQFMKNKTN